MKGELEQLYSGPKEKWPKLDQVEVAVDLQEAEK